MQGLKHADLAQCRRHLCYAFPAASPPHPTLWCPLLARGGDIMANPASSTCQPRVLPIALSGVGAHALDSQCYQPAFDHGLDYGGSRCPGRRGPAPAAADTNTDESGLEGFGPPYANVEDLTERRFGIDLTDHYRWMENPDDSALYDWLRRQEDYTERQTAGELRDQRRGSSAKYSPSRQPPRRCGARSNFSRKTC